MTIYAVNGCADYWCYARFESQAVYEGFMSEVGYSSVYGDGGGWVEILVTDDQATTLAANVKLVTAQMLNGIDEPGGEYDLDDMLNEYGWDDEKSLLGDVPHYAYLGPYRSL